MRGPLRPPFTAESGQSISLCQIQRRRVLSNACDSHRFCSSLYRSSHRNRGRPRLRAGSERVRDCGGLPLLLSTSDRSSTGSSP